MLTTIILIALLFGLSDVVPAEDQTITSPSTTKSDLPNKPVRQPLVPEPTLRILPKDVVQGSIQQLQFSTNFCTNCFKITWKYTEAGAKKVLACWAATHGMALRKVVGRFEAQPEMFIFESVPPLNTSVLRWKEDWLKNPTDRILAGSEGDAKAVVSGLKGK